MKNRNKGSFKKADSKVVPVTMNGVPGTLNTANIKDDQWTHRHGTTPEGKTVNSMKTFRPSRESLILGKTGTTAVLSVSMDEFKVAAAQILSEEGYGITPPTAAS